jgi:hypothetical protein
MNTTIAIGHYAGGYNTVIGHAATIRPTTEVAFGINAEAGKDSISIGYGAKTGDKEIMIANPAVDKYNKITLGHIDVLALVERLEKLEAYIQHHPALVDFDAMATATETAMAETAQNEAVFVNPPETGSTISLRHGRMK